MQKVNLMLLAGAVTMTAMTGCVDNDYDLSDIDTTVQLQVKDLTLPINFDPIQLKSILKPSDDSSIKEFDGEYAVVQNGTITSNEIIIARQNVSSPQVRSTVRQLSENTGYEGTDPGAGKVTYSYTISDVTGDFTYDKNDISSEILAIKQIGTEWTISINISIAQSEMDMESLSFEDVVVSLPKGLTTDNPAYDPATGDLPLGNVTLPAGTDRHHVDIKVSSVDLTMWDANDFTFTPGTGDGKGKIHISGHVGVKSGLANLTVRSGHAASVTMTMAPALSDIKINSFSGRVQYTFSDFNIPDIDINDLPDLLSDPETSVTLANPQLYLSVNNPVANYGLDAVTGLELTPWRNGVSGNQCTLNPGQSVLIGHDKGVAGKYTFCISPEKPADYFEGFAGASQVYCSDLANILSGSGIPTRISVELPDAGTVPGDVTDFILGEPLGQIEGEYTVYCPLELGKGSKIVYTDNVDGWNDESVDRIVISDLKLTTTIVNGLPFDVVLSGYPLSLAPGAAEAVQSIDPSTKKPVNLKEITVGANQSVTITTSTDGTVEHLDGIHFVARGVIAGDDAPVLSPDNTITLNNLRVTVSGSYTDEL